MDPMPYRAEQSQPVGWPCGRGAAGGTGGCCGHLSVTLDHRLQVRVCDCREAHFRFHLRSCAAMSKYRIHLIGPPQSQDHLAEMLGNRVLTRVDPQRSILSDNVLGECESDSIAVETLTHFIQSISALHQIYVGSAIDVRVEGLEATTPGHRPRHVSFSEPFDVIVKSRNGLELLRQQSATGATRCVDLSGAALARPDVALVLQLIGQQVVGWREIYDLIEALGGEDRIVSKYTISRNKVEAIRRTANHHRHLGSEEHYPLPPRPPDLTTARATLIRLVQLWLSERLPGAPRQDEVEAPEVTDGIVISAAKGGEPNPIPE